MLLKPGDTLDRYTIESLLGQGGMGQVYRARDAKLQRSVALKLLRQDVSEAGDARAKGAARLLREARAAAALDHANAIAIHDVGEAGGHPYIAMELVDGTSLRMFIGDQTLKPETRIRWLVDVARALGAAHARGLIHRDIKPENVMVRRDGVIKVLDFGIAQRPAGLRDGAMPSSNPSRPKSPLETFGTEAPQAGTPGYMSPEQLNGETLDARTDQFAWGVLSYELLTGRAPWAGDALSYSVVASVLSEDPAPFTAEEIQCPESVREVVMRALSRDPDDRFPTMDAVVLALSKHVASFRPIEEFTRHASDNPPAERTLTAKRPRRAPRVAGWVVAGLALLGTGAFLLRSSAHSRAAAVIPPTIASAPPAPTRFIDLPLPSSEISDAKAEYLAGMQAIHDASIVPGVRHFNKATEMDETMAVAHLRLLTHGRSLRESDDRKHYEKAIAHRGLLSPRDQALLNALEPGFLAIPPDEREVTKRLIELQQRYPEDAEFRYLVAGREPEPAKSAALFDKVLEIDPDFALALWRKAGQNLMVGDYPSSVSALERCIALVPSSTACLTVRTLVQEELGRCSEMEHGARVLEYLNPGVRSHDLLARALLANGAPIAAVNEALARKWASATPEEVDEYRQADQAHLAILQGDFTTAEHAEQKIVASVERDPLEDDHKDALLPLTDLYAEMGREDQAARLADHYLKARAGWQSDGEWSPVPRMMARAVHGGLRTEEERTAALTEWVNLWEPTKAAFPGQWWVWGYAMPTATAAEAQTALAAWSGPLPRPHTNQFHQEGTGVIGRTFLLGGRAAEAVPLLRAATASCNMLEAPIEHLQARLHLGLALEATGDTAGACAEYKIVLEHWGSAKPRSVSGDRAKARFKALSCEK